MPHAARAKRLACSALLTVVTASSVEGVGHPSETGAARPVHPVWGPDVLGGYASTHIVVKFRRQASGYRLRATGSIRHPSSFILQAVSGRWKVRRVRRAYPYRFKSPQVAARYGLDRTYIIEVPPGTDTVAMAAAFAALEGEIEVAEVDGVGGVAEGFIPDDSDFWRQWGMHNTGQQIDDEVGTPDADIDAPEAWKLHTGDYGTVTVAIVDSGVDPHPEFADRMVPGMNTDDPDANLCEGGDRDGEVCCPGAGLCGAGTCNGGTRDGEECCANGICASLTADHCPHGTHVAGIVAAEGNNGVGVAGVTWAANIMPVRVLGTPDGCSGYESAAAAGIIWAVDNGADIINMSLQYCLGIEAFKDAVDYAHTHGVLVVGAAGNNNWCGSSAVTYPARFANSMAVSATTDDDLLASRSTTACRCWSSNYGDELDVCAPGDRIWSTWAWVCAGGTNDGDACSRDFQCSGGTCTGRASTYGPLSGTSMATPHVSGLAALLRSYIPAMTHDEIRSYLNGTADDLGPTDWDNKYGYGRINAHQALLALGSWPRMAGSSPPDRAIDARQPSDPDGSNPAGWTSVDLIMAGEASQLVPSDLTVTQEGGVAAAPPVHDVEQIGANAFRVTLEDAIEVGAWTIITHNASGRSVWLGYLPADVNGDGASSADDILTLIDALDGSIDSPPIWSIDTDRSGTATPADILREIDLLNGADSYESLPTTLP